MNNLQLVKSESFGAVQCDIYQSNDQFYMTRNQIGQALEYANPQKSIDNIHAKYSERLGKYSVTLKLRGTDGKAYNTTVYTRKGIMEICRHSEQPKADDFMDWVWDVMDDLITGKAVLTSPAELERLKVEAQKERSRAMLLNAQNRTLKTLMTAIPDKKLSPIAVEVFGLKSIQEVTGLNVGDFLPQCEKTYSATEVGKRLGISANKVGTLANRHNLKTDEYGITVMDKSPFSSKEVPAFRYYDKVVPVLEAILKQ